MVNITPEYEREGILISECIKIMESEDSENSKLAQYYEYLVKFNYVHLPISKMVFHHILQVRDRGPYEFSLDKEIYFLKSIQEAR